MTASVPTRTRKRNRVRCPGVNSMGVNAVCVVCAGPTGGHGRSGAARMYALTCHAVFPRLAGGSSSLWVGAQSLASFTRLFLFTPPYPRVPRSPLVDPISPKGTPRDILGPQTTPLASCEY